MRKHFGLMLLLVLSLSTWASASTPLPPQSPPKKEELKIEKRNVVSVTATIEAIDMEKRMVTIRGPEGNVMTVHAGKEVVNLPQVRVGDKVMLDYVESLAVRMAKPGEVKDEMKGLISKAKPGGKPGFVEEYERTVTATIEAIDKAKETVTLKEADSSLKVVKVREPANLAKVKVGDTIVITYTEALALSIHEITKKYRVVK